MLTYVETHQLGEVSIAEAGYFLERDPDSVVAPDVAFVPIDRVGLANETGYFPGRPDLIVEIISPTDEPLDIRRKQALYERVGIPLVWWIDGRKRTATVQAPGQPVRHLSENDDLDGETIVPGFSIQLSELFSDPIAPYT